MSNETPANRQYDSAEDSSVAVQGGGHERSSDAAAAESDPDASTVADDAPPTITTAAATAAANDDDYHISSDTTLNDSSSAVAEGLSTLLSSVIRDFDSRAEDTVRSQAQLSFSIDRLTRELDQLLDDAPLPFIMQHAVKISGVRKRVSSLNTVLKSIQQRLDNIDRMLSVGLPLEKAATEDIRHQ